LAGLVAPFFVVAHLRGQFHPTLVLLIAASTCVPTFMLFYLLGRKMDSIRGVDVSMFRVPLHTVCYAQALVFAYAPIVLGADSDGPPILHMSLGTMLSSYLVAAAFGWLGLRAKARLDRAGRLAALAKSNPELAVHFLTPTHQKTWTKIGPAGVLSYQRWFDYALHSLHMPEDSPEPVWSSRQEETMVNLASKASDALCDGGNPCEACRGAGVVRQGDAYRAKGASQSERRSGNTGPRPFYPALMVESFELLSERRR
jgi:hypothetical protein